MKNVPLDPAKRGCSCELAAMSIQREFSILPSATIERCSVAGILQRMGFSGLVNQQGLSRSTTGREEPSTEDLGGLVHNRTIDMSEKSPVTSDSLLVLRTSLWTLIKR
jgi:hypothetical protein